MKGSTLNGLPLIERLAIARQSILVTARFEEPAVQIESIALGVQILPKSMLRHIPIVIAPVDAEPVPQAVQG